MSVEVSISGQVATARFARPEARNAMTMAMYDALSDFCAQVDSNPSVKVAVLRGDNRAFVSGTDIAHFRSFTDARDGIEYERRIDAVLTRLEEIRVPTIAVVEGYATGGGLSIAAACDLRVCTANARFGLPIAKTLGNCVSMAAYARLAALIGAGRVLHLIHTAGFVMGEEAVHMGLASELATPEALEQRVTDLSELLAGHAPLTMLSSRTALRRLREALPPDEDLIARCYGSDDFHEGVTAFLDKRPPQWRGS